MVMSSCQSHEIIFDVKADVFNSHFPITMKEDFDQKELVILQYLPDEIILFDPNHEPNSEDMTPCAPYESSQDTYIDC